MVKAILKRLLQIIPTLFIIITITFVLTRVIPADPVSVMVGDQIDPAVMESVREELGLNDSMWVQYLRYMKNILHGDFGQSYVHNKPAMQVIAQYLPNTLRIALISMAFAIALGILCGVVSAVYRNGVLDHTFTVLSMFGISVPIFWVAIMLVLVFSVKLGWLPTQGMGPSGQGVWSAFKHMLLPCICLAISPLATFSRITRSSMIDALGNDSITSFRAKGIQEKSIIWKHALKNALPPIITVLGMQLATTFAGAVLTESVFAWPGMGTMISNAIDSRDYALIQVTVLIVAIAFVAINLLADLAYMVINPKVAAEARRVSK